MKFALSQTKLKERIKRKTNPLVLEILNEGRNNAYWSKITKILSSSTRNYSSVNLTEIDKQTTPGDTVVIPGKVLSSGNLTKKVRICALSISPNAKDKLKESKSEYVLILDEMKKNAKAEGIKLIR